MLFLLRTICILYAQRDFCPAMKIEDQVAPIVLEAMKDAKFHT